MIVQKTNIHKDEVSNKYNLKGINCIQGSSTLATFLVAGDSPTGLWCWLPSCQ